MKKASNIRRGRTCIFNIHVHLVFVTKYRRKVFTKAVLKDLGVAFKKVCKKFEAELIELDGDSGIYFIEISSKTENLVYKIVKL